QIPRARLMSRADVLAAFPQVEATGLTGAGVYYDGQMYHPARLVWEFARTARQAGAVLANYCEVTELIRRDGRIVGVGVQDRLGGERFEVQSRMVANAAGPFAERLLVRAGLRPGRAIPFSRDMALVIRRQLVREGALALQTRYRDPDALLSRGNRHLFLVPWHGVTLVGVNSAIHRGDPDGLRVTRAEVEGFLAEINQADPRMGLTWDDIALVYAGLLPIEQGELVGDQVSFGKRAHVVDNAQADGVEGLVTAICNRYTTARGVAERVVDLVGRKLGRAATCRTEVTPLYGGAIARIDDHIREVRSALPPGVGPATAEPLARNHGSAYPAVLRLAAQCSELGVPIAGTGVLRAEVVHAVREELAVHLTDCVFRRTDLGTAGPPGDAALAECASLVAAELGWDEHRTGEELREVRQRYLVADG
ncbi:MAG: glycerol-3-phosphate dehydrogenase/oxidase, partial [Gemmatimonadales bacterium]